MTAIRDPEQPKRALKHANDVRLCVAEFKREIAGLARHEAILAVIDAVDTRHSEKLLGAAKVRHLLVGVAGIGDTKARKLLQVAEIYNGDKRLRELTARQRMLLVTCLELQGWRKRR